MVTNRGRLVTYHEGLLPIILLYPLVTWSFETTGQSKTIPRRDKMSLRDLNKISIERYLRDTSHRPLRNISREMTFL